MTYTIEQIEELYNNAAELKAAKSGLAKNHFVNVITSRNLSDPPGQWPIVELSKETIAALYSPDENAVTSRFQELESELKAEREKNEIAVEYLKIYANGMHAGSAMVALAKMGVE